MPEFTITAAIDGKDHVITATAPEGTDPQAIVQTYRDNLKKPQPSSLPVGMQSALDLAGGIGSSVAALPLGAYNLAREAIPALPEAPEFWKKVTTPPLGPAGAIGKFVGDTLPYIASAGAASPVLSSMKARGIEWVRPGGQLNRLGKIAELGVRSLMEGTAAGGITALQTAGSPTGLDPDAVKTAFTVGAAVPPITQSLKPLWGPISQWWGKMTGQGGEVLRTIAQDADKNFRAAMTDPAAETRLVNNTVDALRKVADKRAVAYQSALRALPLNPVDLTVSRAAIPTELGKFNINPDLRVLLGKKTSGGAAFLNSPIVNKADQDLVRKAVGDLVGWNILDPHSTDVLKQRIYKYAGEASPDAAALLNRLGEAVRSDIAKQVPGYLEMEAGYATASQLLNETKQALGAGMEYGRAKNPGAVVVKLVNSLNQNNEYRKLALEALDEAAGSHLKQDVAGYASRSWVPRGLQGVAAASPFAVLGFLTHGPAGAAAAIPVWALSSPRVAANIVSLIGTMNRAIPTGVGTMAATGLVTGAKTIPVGRLSEPYRQP
jgi:hypothetical protein